MAQVLDYSREDLLPNRFWAKVYPEPNTGCWFWTGTEDGQGYGRFLVDARREHRKVKRAHRVAYEALVGPIPVGLVIDHLCRQRSCVNPEHLEPVTAGVNTLRGESPSAVHALKTHCPSGHPYVPENIQWYKNRRICRACHKVHSREYWRRKAARRASGSGL